MRTSEDRSAAIAVTAFPAFILVGTIIALGLVSGPGGLGYAAVCGLIATLSCTEVY